ncbi:MAG: RNA-binding transcriptional accessory protein [Oscillospiraceae bacterium]|nr:RNA-binding transcriptional accessory protein [Candidatus Equicaccousia limihippi]
MDIIKKISAELDIKEWQVSAAVKLIEEGNTVPFIARYRKEMTGTLDDTALRELDKRLTYYKNLDKRREEIIKSITEQEKMTDELLEKINAAGTLAALEDLYLPYKKKKRTRGTVAREKGLMPLAKDIFSQKGGDIFAAAQNFVNPEKEVANTDDAIAGALDIIAEDISDNAEVRAALREFMGENAVYKVKGDKENAGVYGDYCDFSEGFKKIAAHRVLAINRGEKEGFLKVSLICEEDAITPVLLRKVIVPGGEAKRVELVKTAACDSLKRLIYPSLENQLRSDKTESAVEGAIKVFGLNLYPLLMQPPLKGKTVMGFDPAYRTGCKIAVIDQYGKVLDTAVVYPTPPQNKTEEAKNILNALIKKHGVGVISIGNGTASKESEIFVADLIKGTVVKYAVVSEAGASVYSASELAAKEFPQYDVSLRSAVSIARRLEDPLAELVKIDPKAIGVGQYQHDMPPKQLDETLSGVVENCVNSVGVDLNTASFSLLSHVAGIGEATAKNIVAYREENGAFGSRKQLLKVKGLGDKAFLQCAGFLRIREGENPLDNTAVHPESYAAAQKLLKLCGYKKSDRNFADISSKLTKPLGEIAKELEIGEITLTDMLTELQKPGRDPRDELEQPILRSDLLDINSLKPGMVLTGTVRNVVDFGAFVDIGVHQDGLVHISRICDRFIKHPSEVLKVGDRVTVKITEVDTNKGRIALTMRDI